MLDSKGYTRKRLARCPPGFVLVRQDADAIFDECLPCPAFTYALVEATWDPKVCIALVQFLRRGVVSGTDSEARAAVLPQVLVAASADRAVSLCHDCHFGATCEGENKVTTRENFWRLPQDWQARRADGDGEERASASPVLDIYECPKHACKVGGVCSEGRDPASPVCGSCMEGYALADTVPVSLHATLSAPLTRGLQLRCVVQVCTPCGDAASTAVLGIVLALVGVLFLAAWWLVGWKPFFEKEAPEEEWRDVDELPAGKRFKLFVTGFWKFYGKTMSAYAKIFISFWQIMSTHNVCLPHAEVDGD